MFILNDLSRLCDNQTQFIYLLKKYWNGLHDETNVFRYKIRNLQERIVDQKYLLQLNPDRCTKRRTPEQIDDICQPFDANKFNFTKAAPEECLFAIKNDSDTEVHKVLVNISPISKYHALLCPSVDKCLPQIVTADSLNLVLEIMFSAQDRDLRIGFNSLCALASVNHLHYHLFLENNTLPIEKAECKHLVGNLHCIYNYPVPAFCFKVNNESRKSIAQDSFKLCNYLIKKSVAHNILITRGLDMNDCAEVVRLVIWPRKSTSGIKQFTAFNVAVLELSGWFPVYNKEDYDNLQIKTLENELEKWKLDNFQELCDELIALFNASVKC